MLLRVVQHEVWGRGMATVVSGRADMIRGMDPVLYPDAFVFCTVTDADVAARALPLALASFREEEGLSLLLTADQAAELGLPQEGPMRRITLNVYSSLGGVGLTAAVSAALTARGIACNMIAATLHDHVFVPVDQAEEALDALRALQASVRGA